MKSNKLRNLSFFLASLLTLGAASCGNGGTAETTAGGESTPDAAETEAPHIRYDGRSFRILSFEYGLTDLASGEMTGDIVNDAVFERNARVEEEYGVRLEIMNGGADGDLRENAVSSILAGDDSFDLLVQHVVQLGAMSLENVFYNWYDIPNVDFSHDWWSPSVQNDLTYKGTTFVAIGDLLLNTMGNAYCVFFDKTQAAECGISDLYQTVRDGKWTFDRLKTLIKNTYRDLDGDADRDLDDFYGFCSGKGTSVVNYCWAFDNPFMTRSSDGGLSFTFMSEKAIDKLTGVITFLTGNPDVCYDVSHDNTLGYVMFEAGKAMFANGYVEASYTRFRDRDAAFGMLPYPMYDEAQGQYYTPVDGRHSAMAVPKTEKDLAFVGTIVEALCRDTKENVVPAYYELALKYKYTRDDESVEMLDTIMQSRVYDFGYIYDGWEGILLPVTQLLLTDNTNLTSWYAANESRLNSYYDRLFRLFEEVSAK